MSLSQKLKLLCDENIPKNVVEFLADRVDVKKPFSGSSDMDVAKLAKTEERILLTFDRHFANTLLFPPEQYFGIVFIRIRPPLIKIVLDALLNLLESVKSSEFKGRLFVLSPSGFRMFPGVSE